MNQADLDYVRENNRAEILDQLSQVSVLESNGMVTTQLEVRWGGAKVYYTMPGGHKLSFSQNTMVQAGEDLSKYMLERSVA